MNFVTFPGGPSFESIVFAPQLPTYVPDWVVNHFPFTPPPPTPAIPEASTFILFALGMLVLGLLRKVKQ